MLQNSVVQIATGKLLGATLLPSSVLLLSGIVIWRAWRNKQNHLQAETNELNDELRRMKEQMADLQQANTQATSAEDTPAPSQPQQKKPEKHSANVGLFEFLIEDNIRMRQ